jgi:hypothetical protein
MLVITVQTSDGRPLPGVVVAAHSLDTPDHKPQPVKAVMDQVNRAFTCW